jgi:hypothetical protein
MAGGLTISTLNDSSGVLATQNGMSGIAKAWVRWNGVSGATITASFNVSSITRNGTADYTINFTTAMPDANYSSVYMGQQTATSGFSTWQLGMISLTTNPTASALRIATLNVNNLCESPINCIVVNR